MSPEKHLACAVIEAAVNDFWRRSDRAALQAGVFLLRRRDPVALMWFDLLGGVENIRRTIPQSWHDRLHELREARRHGQMARAFPQRTVYRRYSRPVLRTYRGQHD